MMSENESQERPKVFLVIPVYNHGKTLRDVAVRALAVNENVMVVDDGSTDGGRETLQGLPVTSIRHPENRGKGAAIITAAREARKRGATHIVTIDADGQHDPADYPRFVPLIGEDPDAIIVGARAFDPATTPLLSRFGRNFSNFWLRAQTGYKLKDTQSGFRAYPLSLLGWLKLRERHYDFEVEVLVKAVWAGVSASCDGLTFGRPPTANTAKQSSSLLMAGCSAKGELITRGP